MSVGLPRDFRSSGRKTRISVDDTLTEGVGECALKEVAGKERRSGIYKGKFLQDQVVHGTYINATYSYATSRDNGICGLGFRAVTRP